MPSRYSDSKRTNMAGRNGVSVLCIAVIWILVDNAGTSTTMPDNDTLATSAPVDVTNDTFTTVDVTNDTFTTFDVTDTTSSPVDVTNETFTTVDVTDYTSAPDVTNDTLTTADVTNETFTTADVTNATFTTTDVTNATFTTIDVTTPTTTPETHCSAVLSDPFIVERREVTLRNGAVEEVHRFAFKCSIMQTPISNSTQFEVIFKFQFSYGSGEATIVKSTDASNLDVYLYEEELAPYFGSLVSCCVSSDECQGIDSNSYFAGFDVTSDYSYGYRYRGFPSRYFYYWRCLSASSLQLKLRLTVPLSCWHYTRSPGNQSCQYQPRIIDTKLLNHACPSVITPGNYRSTVDIEPVPVPGRSYYYARILFHKFPCESGFLGGYVIPNIWMFVNGGCRQKTCYSYTDPNIITFDHNWYRMLEVGDYLLFKVQVNETTVVEVHTRTSACSRRRGESCNCGVIVREGNHVVGVDRCNGGTKIIRYLMDPGAPAPVIKSRYSNQFSITMPSGTVIRGWIPSHLNIYATIPGYFERFNVSGLCGNANGDRYDDVMSTQPLHYQSHQLSASESFFNPANIVCRQNAFYISKTGTQRRCGCTADGMSAVCNVTKPVLTRTTGASCSDVTTGRKKRQAENDNFISFDELDYKFPIPEPRTTPFEPVVWPTPSGLYEDDVRTLCTNSIIANQNAGLCGEFDDNAIESCVFDVGATDSTKYVGHLPQLYTDICTTELSQREDVNGTEESDPDLVYNAITGSLMSPEIAAATADNCGPNMCTGRGDCYNGVCRCYSGFGNPDCSFDSNQQSTLEHIEPRVCEMCAIVTVTGTNLPTDGVECKIECEQNGVLVTVMGNATYFMGGTYDCSLTPQPFSVSHCNVSLIWTSKETNSLQFTVFDSTCQQCQTDQMCTPKADACEIDGICYMEGEVNPDNPCLTCNASVSLTSWTPIFDAPTPQSPVSIYKFMGENVNHQLVVSGVNKPNLIYLFASGSPSGLTLSASGLLGWPTDSDYIGVIVIVMQQPCGFQAELRVNLTVVTCLCQNGGTCMQGSGPSGLLFTCVCVDGYNGVLCEVEPGVMWGPWSEWSSCDISTCTRGRERTCLVPPCTGVSSQYQCCPNCISTVDSSEVSQGVHIMFKGTSDINIVLTNAENGFRFIADAVNAYCSRNTKTCCTSLGLDSKGEDTGGFVMTSWELVRIAAGYSTCSHRIQFLVTVLLDDARASCGSLDLTGRKKKRAIGDQYVDSNIVLEALFGIKEGLENEFGVDILSTDVPSLEEPNDLTLILLAGLLPLAAICVLVIIVVACYVYKRKASRREEKHYDNGGFWPRHASRYHGDHWLDSDRRRYSSYSTDSSLIKSRYRYY